MSFLDEAQVEIGCMDLLKGLGYAYANGLWEADRGG